MPGTLSRTELARRLADTDSAAVLKLGRTFPAVLDAVGDAGRTGFYVERRRCRTSAPLGSTTSTARCPTSRSPLLPGALAASLPARPAPEPADLDAPVHRRQRGRGRRHRRRARLADPPGRGRARRSGRPRRLRPVPGPVPPNPGRTAIPATTGSRRARRTPWTWPRQSRSVAVVSGGDPGVFAMAAASWKSRRRRSTSTSRARAAGGHGVERGRAAVEHRSATTTR